MSRRLLTVREAADELGRSLEWTRRMMATSIPGARKVNGRWMVRVADLDRWLNDGAPEQPPARLAIPPRYQSQWETLMASTSDVDLPPHLASATRTLGVGGDGWMHVHAPELGPWQVSALRAVIDGRPEIVGLRIEPRTVSEGGTIEVPAGVTPHQMIVSSAVLREFPLKRLQAALNNLRDPFTPLQREARRGPRRSLPPEHFKEVARVYREAVATGRPPIKTIQEGWGVKRAAASRWVQRARRMGLLGAPLPGRAGEQKGGNNHE